MAGADAVLKLGYGRFFWFFGVGLLESGLQRLSDLLMPRRVSLPLTLMPACLRHDWKTARAFLLQKLMECL